MHYIDTKYQVELISFVYVTFFVNTHPHPS